MITSEQMSILGLFLNRNQLIFAITHQASLGALMLVMKEFRDPKFFKDVSVIYDILIKKMKNKNKNTLKIERKQLLEIFNKYKWVIGDRSKNYPILTMNVEIFLKYKGIEIEYDGKWIIFNNFTLNLD